MKKLITLPISIFSIFCFAYAGCQKQESSAPAVTTAPAAANPEIPAAAQAAASSETGSVKGKIIFSGTAPTPASLDTAADPNCGGGTLSAEDLVVSANGGIRWAFVSVKSGLPSGKTYAAPSAPVVLDQKGCHYTPHVFGIQTGQTLEIVNSDATLHNVHGQSQKSPEFNLGMPLQGMKTEKKFTEPEIMAHFKCDVHPWMSSYMGVVANPFFAVTGEDGSFEIKGLPGGKYTLEIWQEKLGTKTVDVDVTAGAEASAEVTYTA